jgi:hypothetical protein
MKPETINNQVKLDQKDLLDYYGPSSRDIYKIRGSSRRQKLGFPTNISCTESDKVPATASPVLAMDSMSPPNA